MIPSPTTSLAALLRASAGHHACGCPAQAVRVVPGVLARLTHRKDRSFFLWTVLVTSKRFLTDSKAVSACSVCIRSMYLSHAHREKLAGGRGGGRSKTVFCAKPKPLLEYGGLL